MARLKMGCIGTVGILGLIQSSKMIVTVDPESIRPLHGMSLILIRAMDDGPIRPSSMSALWTGTFAVLTRVTHSSCSAGLYFFHQCSRALDVRAS